MSKKRKYHRRSKIKLMKLKKQTVYTVGAVWLWIIAATITLSFFGEGSLLIKIREYLYNNLGWTFFLLPPFLVSLSFLFFKIKSDFAKPNVPGGFAVIIVSLIGITRAGIVGSDMWAKIASAISDSGSFLVFLGFLVVGLIIVFNASLDSVMNGVFTFIQNTVDSFSHGTDKSAIDKKGKLPFFPGKNELKIKGGNDDKPMVKAPANASAQPQVKPSVQTAHMNTTDKSDLKINSPVNQHQTSGLWEYPPLSLLSDGPGQKADRGDVRKNASVIESTLGSFGITAKVEEVNRAPAVTQYALRLASGTKVAKITSLSSDMALALAAPTGAVRIEAPIPGRDLVGIEIPNKGLEFVTLKHMLLSEQMKKAKSRLAVALGLDVAGSAVIADIGKMPHVLVAGTTGSGKSVLINSWICSLLFRTTPEEVRLIMVDPKRVELTGYNGVPHLMTPVIVEPDKILSALRWALTEMQNRYKRFAEVQVRNIDGFNELSGFQAMPYIIILIDELADLMAYAPAEVEDAICRLAQMSRATGIHLVLATQRPSVDVITGLIKANVPTRIAFNVSSMIDSRVVLDMPGAERLLGRGDMLYIPPEQSKPSRIQGTFVSEKDVSNVVEFLREKNMPVEYTEEVINQPLTSMKKGGGSSNADADGNDALFADAVRLVCQYDKASASLLQRKLKLGYARAARILDQLEESGVVGPAEGAKPRDVFVKNADEYFAQQQEVPQK